MDEFKQLLPRYLDQSDEFKTEDPAQIIDRFAEIDRRLGEKIDLTQWEQARTGILLDLLISPTKVTDGE